MAYNGLHHFPMGFFVFICQWDEKAYEVWVLMHVPKIKGKETVWLARSGSLKAVHVACFYLRF
jgi:hypothetical protein